MSDFDNYITITQAARKVPGRRSVGTIWRWMNKGIRARNGEIIKLRYERYGGMYYTTVDWIKEFGRARAEADQQARPNPSASVPTRMNGCGARPYVVSHEQADAELRALGM